MVMSYSRVIGGEFRSQFGGREALDDYIFSSVGLTHRLGSIQKGGIREEKCSYVIDYNKDPKWIGITDSTGKVMLGLYEFLGGREVRVGYAVGKRPTGWGPGEGIDTSLKLMRNLAKE